jgi:hypothetical protein
MRPAPIPDDAIWPGARRIVLSAPNGDLTDPDVAPVEMLADVPESIGGIRYSARCMLEPGDLEKLAGGGHVWVSFYGGVPPFCVDVTDKDGR